MQVSTYCAAYRDLQEVLWVPGKIGEDSWGPRNGFAEDSSLPLGCYVVSLRAIDPLTLNMKTLRFFETPGTTHQRYSVTPPEVLNLKLKDFGSYPKCTNWLKHTYLLETLRTFWSWVGVPLRAWISSLFSRTVKTVPDRHILWLR